MHVLIAALLAWPLTDSPVRLIAGGVCIGIGLTTAIAAALLQRNAASVHTIRSHDARPKTAGTEKPIDDFARQQPGACVFQERIGGTRAL